MPFCIRMRIKIDIPCPACISDDRHRIISCKFLCKVYRNEIGMCSLPCSKSVFGSVCVTPAYGLYIFIT